MNVRQLMGFAASLGALMVLLLAVATAPSAIAREGASDRPDELVQKITDKVLSDIEVYREALDEADTKAREQELLDEFYASLLETLEPVVDLRWIALNVMGEYRQQASDEQRRRFQEVFTTSLVETYGRGLLTYSHQNIRVEPLEEPLGERRRVTVVQKIEGEEDTYPLFYSMGLNREGDWKVINVIINGVNLGKVFRNQFARAASNHDGDIDKVIENWSVSQEFQD